MVSLPFLNFTPYSSCNSYSVFISIRTRVVSGFGRIHCTSNSKKEFLCGRSSSYRWPEVLGDSDQRLCLSRQFVREARKKEIEIFDTSKKFILMPFELRFLSCCKATGSICHGFIIQQTRVIRTYRILSDIIYWGQIVC